MMLGPSGPKITRLGVDVSGRVEAVGSSVKQFRPGDEVFGSGRGAFAEYVCTSESELATKPSNVTWEQAASAPVAGFTALQSLRDKGQVQPGHKVLINGAAGGVGTFAVQIAKYLGAHVTGVCSTRNVDMVRSIGADRVIDYTQQSFTKSEERYDVFLDCIGNHSLSACRHVLNPRGIYIMIGGPKGPWIDPLPRFLKLLVLSRFVSQKLTFFMANPNQRDLTVLGEMMEAGKVKPVIDKRYRLSEVPEALRYLGKGHARGKVVIAVEENAT